MSELNKKFPGILVGWLSGNGYIMPPEECNDLTRYVSGLELRLAEAENARPIEDALLAELEAAKAALDAVYKIVTRQLSDPQNDTAALVEIAGIIEKARGEG